MSTSRRILIKSKTMSWFFRFLIAVLVLAAVLVCTALNLQYLYQFKVDDYFQERLEPERSLLIRTGSYTLVAKGKNRRNFIPLLQKELGEYKDHEFLGWSASLDHLLDNGSLPYTMLYQVDYEKGSTREKFYFTGYLIPVLAVRDVQLPTFPTSNQE